MSDYLNPYNPEYQKLRRNPKFRFRGFSEKEIVEEEKKQKKLMLNLVKKKFGNAGLKALKKMRLI